MSVTFFCPEAPVILKPSSWEPGEIEKVSVLPEINVSNSNAVALLDLMGLPSHSECGTAPTEELDKVIAALELSISTPEARIATLEPTVVNNKVVPCGVSPLGELLRAKLGSSHESKQANVVDFGRTDSYVVTRATALRELFVLAKLNGWAVSWG